MSGERVGMRKKRHESELCRKKFLGKPLGYGTEREDLGSP